MSKREEVIHLVIGFIGSFALLSLFYQQILLRVTGAIGGSFVFLFLRKRELAEKKKWNQMIEFKDVMDSMIAALIAGYSMENAVTEAYDDLLLMHGRETGMAKELKEIQNKLQLQHTLDALLVDLGRRTGVEDIITFAQVYATARRSGGNLVSVMKRTAKNIGERIEMKREIQTMITGKKMEANCMMLIPSGILLYLRVFSPDFLKPLYGNLFGTLFMSVMFLTYCISVFWCRRIMEISC